MNGFSEPIPPAGPEPRPRNSAKSTQQHHHRLQPATQPSWNPHLESVGSNIAGRYLIESPSAMVLVVEDLCWQAATEDWKHRRPHWWQPRMRSAWVAEGERLDAKAARLRQLADDVFQEL